MVHKPIRGGFAVGARYADDSERIRRLPGEDGGHPSAAAAAVSHNDSGPPLQAACRLHDCARGPALKGFRHKGMTILLDAANGDKERSGSAVPAPKRGAG